MKEREVAYQCLVKVINEKQFSNIVLKNNKEVTPLVTQLVYGTLRNYRLVREAWSKYASKMPSSKVAILLDMATYELLLMNKPEYATVNEIVEISKGIKGGNSTNFVNAVLRKLNKNDVDQSSLAVATSHPDWLVNMWNAHYGKQQTEIICKMDCLDAKVSLRVNNLLTTKQELLKDKKFSSGSAEGCVYYDGNIIDTDYFKKGLVIIQSESSQLAVDTIGLQDGWQVLDLCAAPGSKTVQIASLMHNTGKVVSNDVYDFRCELIKKNVKKYNLSNVEVVNYDGREINQHYSAESFDAVLLDAPCSGLGTLRHKPEIKITTTPNDLDNIVALQKQLLNTVDQMVKKGGILVYSTCTLNKKENEKQVDAFLKNHPEFSLISSKTIFPSDYDSDGFYVAKMVKND